MKYMIMMLGDQNTMMEVKSPEWIRGMIEFMGQVGNDLTESGELVDGQGLADPSQAKVVRIKDGIPVATDGPYAEAKEVVGGWAIMQYADLDEAVADQEEFARLHAEHWPEVTVVATLRQISDGPEAPEA